MTKLPAIIKVILIDDHEVVRDGIKAIIERKSHNIKVIGEASNGEEALKLAEENPADIYIVDISLPIMNGIELTLRLKKIHPKSSVIILSMHDKHILVEKALGAGAQGYVVKESATEEIIKAIREVSKSRIFLSPQIAGSVVSQSQDKIHFTQKESKVKTLLTKRERQVLQLIAEGFTNPEIAKKLSRSSNTIHVHRNRIMQKLNLHRQADLIRYALKENISFV